MANLDELVADTAMPLHGGDGGLARLKNTTRSVLYRLCRLGRLSYTVASSGQVQSKPSQYDTMVSNNSGVAPKG
jgi:hypothetical protein